MKKWLVFLYFFTSILAIVCVIMCLVILFKPKPKASETKPEENQIKQDIELKANQTIRVKLTKTNEIIAMDINDYLRGVVPAEMPPSYEMEALKAQAVVARTYTYRKLQGLDPNSQYDITDSYTDSQAFYTKEKLFEIWKNKGYSDELIQEYWSKVTRAVNETTNIVAIYNGNYIKAFFHASSPKKTENVDQIWGGEKLSYLVSVDNVEDETYTWNKSYVNISKEDFKSKICEVVNKNFTLNNRSNEQIISINEHTTSGRIKNVKIGDDIVSAEKLRILFGLRSTDFNLEVTDNEIKFEVSGNGHRCRNESSGGKL